MNRKFTRAEQEARASIKLLKETPAGKVNAELMDSLEYNKLLSTVEYALLLEAAVIGVTPKQMKKYFSKEAYSNISKVLGLSDTGEEVSKELSKLAPKKDFVECSSCDDDARECDCERWRVKTKKRREEEREKEIPKLKPRIPPKGFIPCPTCEDSADECGCVELETRPDNQVEHPNHYNKGIECWDYTTSHNMGFLDGNVVKYVTRFKHKNGLQDLLKARQYLDKLIAVEEGK